MNEFFYFWYFIGALYIFILTYQDFKKKMLVDDRFNYSMFGLTLGLIHIMKPRILLIIGLLIAVLFLGFLWKRYIKGFGEADISTFSWIFYGFMLVKPELWFFFILVLIFCSIIQGLIKKIILRYDKPTPFYLSILISYLLTGALFNLF